MLDLNRIIFENYKCFKNETIIKNIKPINIVIGKNNIGKSSLLDIIEFIYNPVYFWDNRNAKISIEKDLTEKQIKNIFRTDTSGGIIGGNHYEYGKKFIGMNFRTELTVNQSSYNNELKDFEMKKSEKLTSINPEFEERLSTYWARLAKGVEYKKKITKRIYAERDIEPEIETNSMEVEGDGKGITSIINNYINKAKYDESKIRIELLNRLNEIMGMDAHFSEITTQQIEYGNNDIRWEIFLREDGKGRIALSKSGSGLKTILMILVYTILIPDIEKKICQNIYFFLKN